MEKDTIDIEDFNGAHNLALNGKEIFRDGQYITHLITEEVKKWLNEQDKEQPFFLYLPYTAPHDPFQGPNDDLGRPLQGEEWRFKSREKYIEMVEAMDKSIGEIMETLTQKKMDEETIVIFFSDNGGTRIANNGIYSGYGASI